MISDRWLISDTHFGHKNIIKYENRPFTSVEEMDETLIENWNRVVKPYDVVFHLGDVFICSTKRQEEIMARLNGRKHLLRGNHDKQTLTKLLKMGWLVETHSEFEPEIVDKSVFGIEFAMCHSPIKIDMPLVHGHVHSQIQDLDQTKFKCVSVECINYTPIHMEEILSWVKSL